VGAPQFFRRREGAPVPYPAPISTGCPARKNWRGPTSAVRHPELPDIRSRRAPAPAPPADAYQWKVTDPSARRPSRSPPNDSQCFSSSRLATFNPSENRSLTW